MRLISILATALLLTTALLATSVADSTVIQAAQLGQTAIQSESGTVEKLSKPTRETSHRMRLKIDETTYVNPYSKGNKTLKPITDYQHKGLKFTHMSPKKGGKPDHTIAAKHAAHKLLVLAESRITSRYQQAQFVV